MIEQNGLPILDSVVGDEEKDRDGITRAFARRNADAPLSEPESEGSASL